MHEVQKAHTLCVDLAAAMMYIMLVRDAKGTVGVPVGGTHDWMYSIHGWAILFLQVLYSCVPQVVAVVSYDN